ncbi:MAG: ChbG/HpnK family deacetylase [Pirellulaceae bacterium]
MLGAVVLMGSCCSADVVVAQHETPRDDIYLIVRSDDMGMTHAVNQACLKTVTNGIARSIEVIVPAPWFPEAAHMLQQHPEIDVGVHLDLTSEWSAIKWGPVSAGTKSLVDMNGHFYPTTRQLDGWPPSTGFLESGWKINEVERELRAQIETAKRLLPNVTHLSAHMGTATCTAELKTLVDFLAQEYELPIVLPKLKRAPRWTKQPTNSEEGEAEMVRLVEGLKPGLWLFVEHPGVDCPEMKAVGHLGNENVCETRAAVTAAFTSDKVKEVARRRGIKLISYAEALEMQ